MESYFFSFIQHTALLRIIPKVRIGNGVHLKSQPSNFLVKFLQTHLHPDIQTHTDILFYILFYINYKYIVSYDLTYKVCK